MTREEAIDVLKHNYPSACYTDLCEAVEMSIQALSAQPEHKRGKWIKKTKTTELNGAIVYDSVWICPECGTTYDGSFAFNFVKYCYCCGIDLRAEGEQES